MMKFNQSNTALRNSTSRSIKWLTLSLAATAMLSGCNLFESDDPVEEKNVPPVTVTVDLITQTETAITDMLSATDQNGDTLTFSLAQQAVLGMVTVNNNGDFTYQPNDEVTGSDSFTYSVSDGINPAVTGTVNITIEALEVSFASYSRAAFNQQASDKPLATNGRVFIQDVEDSAAYDDLLGQ
jgi:VCBS repeat-containing protein